RACLDVRLKSLRTMNSFASLGFGPTAWSEPLGTTGMNDSTFRDAESNRETGIWLFGNGVLSNGFTSCFLPLSWEKSPLTSASVGGNAVVLAAWRRSVVASNAPKT